MNVCKYFGDKYKDFQHFKSFAFIHFTIKANWSLLRSLKPKNNPSSSDEIGSVKNLTLERT